MRAFSFLARPKSTLGCDMEKIGKFNAEDPFLLSEQLTEEERMIA
jgi:hypothetical protein